jgi:hypothetical protein
MGAEGFGSDSFNDAGEMVRVASFYTTNSRRIGPRVASLTYPLTPKISGTGGGSNTLGFNVSQQGFLRRGMNDPKQMLEIGKEVRCQAVALSHFLCCFRRNPWILPALAHDAPTPPHRVYRSPTSSRR